MGIRYLADYNILEEFYRDKSVYLIIFATKIAQISVVY